MAKIKQFRTLEEGILLLQREAKAKQMSIGEILHILSGRGRPLILILLSLPFCQPIQIPGFSTPFGLAVAFIGLRITMGKHIWLPQKLLSQTIPDHTLAKIMEKTLSVVKTLKHWIYPRLYWLCRSPFMEIMNGLTVCVLGLFLALPLPIPFSNLMAAWAILLIAMGMLEDDGLLVCIGYAVAILMVALFVVIALSIKHIL